jgi:hypothetical protein
VDGIDNRTRPVAEEAVAKYIQVEGYLNARLSDRLALQDYTATKGIIMGEAIMGCAAVSADGYIAYDEDVTMHRYAIQDATEASSC